MGIAIGQMGLDLESFLSLTPYEFQAVHTAFIKKTQSDRDWEEIKDLRVARWQVLKMLCRPQKKEISVYDLIELPGDKEQKERMKAADREQRKKSTPERFAELKNKWRDE